MTTLATELPTPWTRDPRPYRCQKCHGPLAMAASLANCPACGSSYPIHDDVLIVKEQPNADNRIAADFYNGPLWPKFRFWEKLFWIFNGGERRARGVILKQLPEAPGLRLLDIAIGDGVYTSWLPESWSTVGLDVSTSQLAGCRRRNEGRDLRLVLAEAEDLPFHDDQFDVILSIGGFNHFNDPEGALREMVRVARPGAKVVISDELPDITDWLLGRKIGLPGLDRWVVSRLMRLGDDFTDLVERHRHLDIAAMGARVLRDARYQVIWRGGGYLLTGHAP